MSLRDLFDAARRATPPRGGDGRTRSTTGEELDLELFEKANCPYCQRVFRAVTRLAVPVRMRDVRNDPDAARTLVATGGKMQVPCLFVNGKPLYESTDIIRFLDEKFAAR